MAYRQQPQRTFRRAEHNQRFAAAKPEAKAPEQGGDEKGFFESIGSGALGVARQIDDSTQAFVRNQLLQLPTDGTRLQEGAFMKAPRNALGEMVFAARNKYEGDNTAYRGDGTRDDNIGLGLTRALQGGTITAAGYGLAQLTTQFGSQADYQEPNQLSL